MVLVTTMIVALTELLKRIEAKDYRGAALIVLAGVIGAVAGYFHVESLTVETGIVAGLGAAGIYQIANVVRGNTLRG